MGGSGLDPNAVLVVIVLSLAIWLGGQAVTGAKWVGRQAAHITHVAGCGVKHALTGHGCEDSEKTP